MSEKRIKVLFISSWYPNRVNPTLGNFVQKHAEAVSIYADVTVLHVCFDEKPDNNKNEIVWLENASFKTLIIYCKKPSIPVIQFFRYLKAYRKGLKIINEQHDSFDIVHANVLFPVGLVFRFIKAFKKLPYVVTEHWTGYMPEDPSKVGCIRKYLLKKIARGASMIMPVSEDLKDAMIHFGLRGNYQVIPNVVDDEFFKPTLIKNKNNKVKFLHVSSLDDCQKNISGIIRVIHQLSLRITNFEFLIVGDGNADPFIKMAQEFDILDKYVFFESKKSTSEISSIMKQSDCLVMFSNFESFSVVIAEGLASGLPVIATNAGGIAGRLTKEHGIIIQPGDENELLNAIIHMIEHHEEYNKEILMEFADKFRAKKVGEAFLNMYKQIIN